MGVDRNAMWMLLAIIGPMTMGGSAPVSAEEIYKSIDQSGKVTYSTGPLAGAVTTKTLPPPYQPTPEEVRVAEEQFQQIKAFGAELEKDREQREAEQARQAAAERAQPNAGPLVIVYVPVPVLDGLIRPISNHRGQPRLHRDSRSRMRPPRLL